MSVQLQSAPLLCVSVTEPVTDKSSDTALITACQTGDHKAFDLLMKRHRRTIYAILHRLAPDWSAHHDDYAQEIMIRVFRSIKGLRNPGAFKAWLNQTATNLFYDELRRKPNMTAVSIDSAYSSDEGLEASGMDIADLTGQPDEILMRKEIMREVNSAIAKLPTNYQDAIILRELHGLAYDEIAVLTKTEVGTVKSRLSRARTKVQHMLEKTLCA